MLSTDKKELSFRRIEPHEMGDELCVSLRTIDARVFRLEISQYMARIRSDLRLGKLDWGAVTQAAKNRTDASEDTM